MKRILVPTDFSDTSQCAVEYAVEFAKVSNSEIILFHVYQIPVATADVVLVIPAPYELETLALDSLKKIQTKYGSDVIVDYFACSGFVIDEIIAFSVKKTVDLIIMGMSGGGFVTEKLIGSTTTSLLRKSKCPVLAIHPKTKFKVITKIVLAHDTLGIDEHSVKSLIEFASIFNAHVSVLHVVSQQEYLENKNDEKNDIQLNKLLVGINHSFHYIANNSILNGINDYVSEFDMDLIVMIPRKHSVFKALFHESETTRLAFHSSLPLLAIHN